MRFGTLPVTSFLSSLVTTLVHHHPVTQAAGIRVFQTIRRGIP